MELGEVKKDAQKFFPSSISEEATRCPPSFAHQQLDPFDFVIITVY